LLPYGLFGGYIIMSVFAPLAFPSAYLDGTHGASAVDVFVILLAGWAFTLLATPTYTSLMAGHHPWRFTAFIVLVLVAASLLGYGLVLEGPEEPARKLHSAAVASSLSAGFLLVLSWWMSGEFDAVQHRKIEWFAVLLGSLVVVVGLFSGTLLWVLGLPLFWFTKQGWRAIRATSD